MKGTSRTTATLTALATALALSPAATAQPPMPQDFLDKAEYVPGGVVKIALGPVTLCSLEATSTGFAAPVTLIRVPGATTGEGKAAATPGKYEARILCKGGPVVDSFTIKAPVSTTTPRPPMPPVKKPKGAPQTGGGGTA